MRVPGLGNLRTVALISLGKASQSIPVADVQVARLKAAGVDRDIRAMEKTSDHAPTWVELEVD